MPVFDPGQAPPPPTMGDMPFMPDDAQAPMENGTPSQPTPTAIPAKKTAEAEVVTGRMTVGDPDQLGISMILYGPEKWGKTTFGAFAPNSVIYLAPRELGYLTLQRAKTVPESDCAKIDTWEGLKSQMRRIAQADHVEHRNIVLDALTGLEAMLHKHVCDKHYGGDWGPRGFMSYREGYETSVEEWRLFLDILDEIKFRGINVILLGHSQVKTFNNPAGPDYDRYVCDIHPKTWSPTSKWADVILFGTYKTAVDTGKAAAKASDKGKGIAGTKRIVYTERCDAYDAGSRFQIPRAIDIPNDHTKVWETITKHFL